MTMKLIQFEKHRFCLCSRACSQAKVSNEFNVLKTVAFAVAPNIKITELQKIVNYPLTLLRILSNSGRFVFVKHNQSLLIDLQKIDELSLIVIGLSEQNQALDAKLFEQNHTIQTLGSHMSLLNEHLSLLLRSHSKENNFLNNSVFVDVV